jgi:hypothetical protein
MAKSSRQNDGNLSGSRAVSKGTGPEGLHASTDRDRTMFGIVGDMEDDVSAVENFADAIAIMSETIDDGDPLALCLQRLAWEIKVRASRIGEQRGKLFHMTHPNREHFEREGWPD